ncbi:MAG: RNA polymerase sigma factor [Saprospiraceae bacterium]
MLSSRRNMHFEEIYHSYKKMVYNLALQYVQNTEDAQEIAQDVFVAVHQMLDSFRAESSTATWIYRITINKSLDHIKAKKRKKRFAFITSIFYNENNEINHDSPNFNHPGVMLEDKEALEKLFILINLLPDNQKTALILSKIEQKSQLEVAEIMSISVKAVESLLQRAKTNLSKKIQQEKD